MSHLEQQTPGIMAEIILLLLLPAALFAALKIIRWGWRDDDSGRALPDPIEDWRPLPPSSPPSQAPPRRAPATAMTAALPQVLPYTIDGLDAPILIKYRDAHGEPTD